jgi:hypothetical protein
VSDLHDSPRAAFDDDRLLDYVLGIEDDPELASALAQSAQLRERLADLTADLAAIESELRQALPPLDAAYTEPSAARWPRLQRFLGPEPAVRRRPLRGRRLTAVFAAAALTLAIVVGLVSVLPRMHPVGSSSTSSAGSESQRAAAPSLGAFGSQSAPSVGAVPQPGAASGSLNTAVAAQAGDFRDVAVARAGAVTGDRQPFTVVRLLKGSVPTSLTLRLPPGTTPAAAGSLQIVYLRPTAEKSATGAGAGGSDGASGTGPSVKGTTGTGSATGVRTIYSFDGRPALATALARGVDPSAVRLP